MARTRMTDTGASRKGSWRTWKTWPSLKQVVQEEEMFIDRVLKEGASAYEIRPSKIIDQRWPRNNNHNSQIGLQQQKGIGMMVVQAAWLQEEVVAMDRVK